MMYDSSDLTELLALALGAVRAGARLALDPGQALRIETKRNRNDVVTQVDRAVEALMARRLAPAGYPLVGEEGHAAGGWAGRVWVLDPIDGTLNYIAVHRHWAISLALVEDGRPVAGVVADPVDDRVYTAVVGAGARVRRLFAESDAGAELARIADVPLADGIVIAHLHGLEEVPRLARIIEGTRGLRCYGAAALEMVEAAAGRARRGGEKAGAEGVGPRAGPRIRPRIRPRPAAGASRRGRSASPPAASRARARPAPPRSDA